MINWTASKLKFSAKDIVKKMRRKATGWKKNPTISHKELMNRKYK